MGGSGGVFSTAGNLLGLGGNYSDPSRYGGASINQGEIQKFLPNALRNKYTKPILRHGIQNIGQLLQNPGGLNPNVAAAISPRLALESQRIAENFRNISAQQSGAATRTNTPVSIQNALQRALDVAQERAQRETRQTALSESEQLRRSDLSNFYDILNAIAQFTGAGRQAGTEALTAQSQTELQSQAGTLSLIGSLVSSAAQYYGSSGGSSVV